MGEGLLKFLRWLLNSAQQAAIAEAPSVMTAAGLKINRNTGKVEYNHLNDKGVKQLRSNLADIGEAGATAPGAAKAIETGYNIIRHPKETYRATKQLVKSVKSLLKPKTTSTVLNTNTNTFKSELDWSPESWFGDYAKRKNWSVFDELSLALHVSEYHNIEKNAKATGNWLKMPDGSTWQGDPREWVMLMSKDAQWLSSANGFRSGVKPLYLRSLPEYTGDVFEANSPVVYESFANYEGRPFYTPFMGEGNTFSFAVPKLAKIKTIVPRGGDWTSIKIGNEGKHIETLIKEAKQSGYDGLRINNIQEGPQAYIPGNLVTDDFIIFENTPRKIITGNNGNFDPASNNNFGGFIPYVIGGVGYGLYDTYDK